MTKHGIAPHVKFSTEVTDATWNDETAAWQVQIRDTHGHTDTLTARALICAVGQFSNPVIPDIQGANDFGGPAFHTADWRDDVDLTGKRVAVVGAGASGFQLVPAIADLTEHVDVYQRTPQWMAPNVTTTNASETAPSGPSATCRTTRAGCGSCPGGRSPTPHGNG